MSKDPHRYDDIIMLPHFVSKDRPHMSQSDRAAQFAPFSALTGFGDSIIETARETETAVTHDESEYELLDRKIRIIAEHIQEQPEISITYFAPDLKKEGGSYKDVSFRVKNIDLSKRLIISTDKVRYEMDQILDIRSALIDEYFSMID